MYLRHCLQLVSFCHRDGALTSVIPLKAEKQWEKDMNQMDERGLSLAVIDPFAPGMIQDSFGETPSPLACCSIHPHRLSKDSRAQFGITWRGADGMRCYQFE